MKRRTEAGRACLTARPLCWGRGQSFNVSKFQGPKGFEGWNFETLKLWKSRSGVGGAVGFGTVVIAAVFVFVSECEVGLDQRESSQRCDAGSDGDLPAEGAKVLGRDRSAKHWRFVAAGRNSRNAKIAAGVGNRVVRRCQGDDHGAHFSMKVAEDKRDAGFVELNEPCGPTLIKPKIEALSLKERNHVVKKRITIGKLHFAADRDHQQRRMEHFVLLHQLRNF